MSTERQSRQTQLCGGDASKHGEFHDGEVRVVEHPPLLLANLTVAACACVCVSHCGLMMHTFYPALIQPVPATPHSHDDVAGPK